MRPVTYIGTTALALAFSSAILGQSRLYEDFVPEGSLHLGQAMASMSREALIKQKPLYEAVTAAGIKDADIADGSLVAVRIFCCGGITKELSAEVSNSRLVFVPRGYEVGPDDIVEFRVGHAAKGKVSPVLNTVTGVVQKGGTGAETCWWDPRDETKWLRVLFCDWMPAKGWVKQEGVNPAWFKPAEHRR